MKKPFSPCKGCMKRHAECHSTCEEYINFQRDNNEFRRKRFQEESSTYFDSMHRKRR